MFNPHIKFLFELKVFKYYHRGMAIFVHAKGGLMYEAAIAGQKFSFKPL